MSDPNVHRESADRAHDAPDPRAPKWLWPGLCLAIIVTGTLIRARAYAANKALWLDEAYLAINILKRDYAELIEPLDYLQKAPFLFLAGTRFATEAFGGSEHALRLLPFAASLCTLPLFYALLRNLTMPGVQTIALILFAVAQPMIYYASETKPYTIDLLVAMCIGTLLLPERVSILRGVVIGVFGAVSVWMSFTSVFVWAGSGGVACAFLVWRRDWKSFFTLSTALLLTAGSFAAYYLMALNESVADRTVRAWWSDAFMPFPPSHPRDLLWFARTGLDVFRHPVGLVLPGLGVFAFVLGWIALWNRDRRALAVLFAPMAVALFASGLELYPYHERFLLFTAFPLIWLVAEGIVYLRSTTERPLVPALLMIILLIHPVLYAARDFVSPRPPQGLRDTYEYLKRRFRPGDAMYVHHWASPSLQYLYLRDGIAIPKFTEGVSARREWRYYVTEMDAFRGMPRVWFLFTKEPQQLIGQEEQFFLSYLDGFAYREESVESDQSNLYLYDLSGKRFPTDVDD